MPFFSARLSLPALCAGALLTALPASAQIADLFGGGGGAPVVTRPVPELDRPATAPAPAPQRQPSREPTRPGQAAAPSTAAATPATASPRARDEKLVIYTTPTCPHCIRALKHMQGRNIPYIQKDVQHNEANRAEFKRIGGRGVPHMLMGSTPVVGFDPADFDRKYAAWKGR